MHIYAHINEPTVRRTFRKHVTDTRGLTVYDKKLRGFGLKVAPDGTKTFFVRTVRRTGPENVIIGKAGRITAAEARRRAAAELEAAKTDRVNGPLFRDHAEQFMRRQARRWKPSTQESNRHLLNRYILPFFGDIRVADIAPADVRRWFDSMSATPANANRAVPILSVMMTQAELWNLRPQGSNPCRKIRRYPTRLRERFLSLEELNRLGFVLDHADDTQAAAAVRYRERRKGRWKPSSLETFDIYLRNRLMLHFGRLRLDTIDHARVSAWFDAASAEKPGAANRAYEILRAMLNTARQWGELRESVPDACANIVKNRRKPVARYLNREELNRLGAVLDRHEQDRPWPVAAIRLLTLTGARLSEVLNLRWDEIGELFENGATARLADSKTGPRTIWLGTDAAQLVARLPRDEHAVRIFPEALASGLLYRFWCEVREQAGLTGLRIHDCRHTWASQGVINGVGLPTVGRLLGHRRHRTTAIYAHLDDAALRDAAAQTSLVIAGAMRYKARPQSDNASGDRHNELLRRPEPKDKKHVTRAQHPEHVPLDRKICVLPTDASTGKAANPKTPNGFFRI